ncbi:MAG: glycosyl hydrolase family 28-related protein [Myxococcota bacterium]
MARIVISTLFKATIVVACLSRFESAEASTSIGCPDYRVDTRTNINVRTFGAIPNDGKSDTAAFQLALNQLESAPEGGAMLIPAGKYHIDEPLLLRHGKPVHVRGVGSTSAGHGSVLVWNGETRGPILRARGISNSVLEGFGFTVSSKRKLSYALGIETYRDRDANRNTFRELVVTAPTDQLGDGIRLDAGDSVVGGDGPNVGNAQHCFERVRVMNHSGKAIWIRHPSSTRHLFLHVDILGSASNMPELVASAGLSTAPGDSAFKRGASFRWFGGQIGRVKANFELADPVEDIHIEAVNSEFSDRAIRSVGESSGRTTLISYRSGRFVSRPSTRIPVVDYDHGDRVEFIGNLVSSWSDWSISIQSKNRASLLVGDNHFQRFGAQLPCQPALSLRTRKGVIVSRRNNLFEVLPSEGCAHGSFLDDAADVSDRSLGGEASPSYVYSSAPAFNAIVRGLEPSVIDVTRRPFNAVPNDGRDDTKAFAAAFRAAEALADPKRGMGGVVVFLPSGSYILSESLRLNSQGSVLLHGEGSSNETRLHWVGPDDRPALMLDELRESVFGYFSIRAERPLLTGIEIRTRPPLPVATNLGFYDVAVDGGRESYLGYGIRVRPGHVITEQRKIESYAHNNEAHFFSGCSVRGYREAAYSIEHGQAKTMHFLNSSFDGYGRGRVGVSTNYGAQRGSFKWYGGRGGNNAIADFELGAPTDFILVRDGVFSGSKTFLSKPQFSSPWSVSVLNNRWTGKPGGKNVVLIDLGFSPGPVRILGNHFHVPGDPRSVSIGFDPKLRSSPSITIRGNDFDWAGSSSSIRIVAPGRPPAFKGNRLRTGHGELEYRVIERESRRQ